MLNLDQVIMTKEEPWDPSKYDDMHLSNKELTQRIPSTPVSSTNQFYGSQGDIVAYNLVCWGEAPIVYPIPDSNNQEIFVFDLSEVP